MKFLSDLHKQFKLSTFQLWKVAAFPYGKFPLNFQLIYNYSKHRMQLNESKPEEI
jgi:hypothetical protein